VGQTDQGQQVDELPAGVAELDGYAHPARGEEQTREPLEHRFVGAGDGADVEGDNDPASGHPFETVPGGGTHR